MERCFWLIPIFPLGAWVGIWALARLRRVQGDWLALTGTGLALLASLGVLGAVMRGGTFALEVPWVRLGEQLIRLGVAVDPLTAAMLAVVSGISFLVQVYSLGYMHGDSHYSRYYANLSLFTAAMLTLVLADNYLLLLIGWELVGLCSFLLIGHWFEREEARQAAVKAFITTRVGDLGLILAAVLLYWRVGSFSFREVFAAAAEEGVLSGPVLTAVALGILAAAVGKSAQFPLHVWLPDAMAGPTPVSALIHAATMVAAGIYLVARSYPLLALAPVATTAAAFVGGLTALLAALIALAMTDLKKVLAYSTISQLGYMLMAVGLGSPAAATFHLVTHAFFKALLFLAAGSVIHAAGTQELHALGGLGRRMPVTAGAFLLGGGALAGLPPLAGFWSKDAILEVARHSAYPVLYWVGLGTAFLTAFYIGRAFILAFLGRPRSEGAAHGHESPAVMVVPLLVLSVAAAVAGFINSPWSGRAWERFLAGGAAEAGHGAVEAAAGVVTVQAVGAGLLGLALAALVYSLRPEVRARVLAALGPAVAVLRGKFYLDELYRAALVRPVLRLAEAAARFDLGAIDRLVNAAGAGARWLSSQAQRFDQGAIDVAVNWVGLGAISLSDRVRRLQTGYVASYLAVMVLSALGALVVLEFLR